MPALTSAAAWPVQAPFFFVLAAGILYPLGGRRHGPGYRRPGERRLRAAAFYAGLLTIVVALDTPLDPLADTLFLAHMTQHLLLLVVAPPLIALSAPWLRLWQPLPLGFRRTVAKSVARDRCDCCRRRCASSARSWMSAGTPSTGRGVNVLETETLPKAIAAGLDAKRAGPAEAAG